MFIYTHMKPYMLLSNQRSLPEEKWISEEEAAFF